MLPALREQAEVSAASPFAALRWPAKADPEPDSPEGRAALAQLIRELLAAGWEREGRGRHWYAQRFCWRREGAPPAAATAAREAGA